MAIKTLRNKKCLITGAASGIGRATAIAAAREGAQLYLTDVNAAELQRAVAELQQIAPCVRMARAFDIADLSAVRAFAEDIHQADGSLDVLMNIAGISIWGTVEHLQHEHWRRCVDINLMGPIHVIECFMPPMIAAGKGGHLVNVSSAAGLFGLPWHAAYSASKFGLRGVSEVLRFDLRRHRIGVSLVCPGGVNTGLVNTLEIVGFDAKAPDALALRRRFQDHAITPEDAARAIIKGIKANRYMVFTSMDVRVGYWFQRKFAWPYEIVMRVLNHYLHSAAVKQRRGSAPRSGSGSGSGSR
jgi:NAD(P)-dependent dehydrogenase (short-subunit alcohol dehydrogenase family)